MALFPLLIVLLPFLGSQSLLGIPSDLSMQFHRIILKTPLLSTATFHEKEGYHLIEPTAHPSVSQFFQPLYFAFFLNFSASTSPTPTPSFKRK